MRSTVLSLPLQLGFPGTTFITSPVEIHYFTQSRQRIYKKIKKSEEKEKVGNGTFYIWVFLFFSGTQFGL
jgi:hypothetical protein